MSYILDALRKSDLQRQRGATPTLLAVQESAVARKRPAFLAYGLLAAVLVGAGMVIGWLRPWQPEQAAPLRPESVATKTLEPTPRQPAPAPSEIAPQPKPEPKPQPKMQNAARPAQTAPALVPTEPQPPARVPEVIPIADLPLSVRQELPAMTISVHAYSGNPGNRLVGIDNRMLREGDYVVPGLQLEQITPDGMIFGYQGYRFHRGVK